MLSRALLFTSALTLFACGGLVVFDPDEEGEGGNGAGSPGPGPGPNTSSSSSSAGGAVSAYEAYCTAVDQAESDPEDCSEGLDLDACIGAEQCATNILRPDTGPLLLECLAKQDCNELPFECVLGLKEFGLTPFGQAFFEECMAAGPCFEVACHQAYWLTDEVLATSMDCFAGASCGSLDNCYEDTALWQCNGFLRKVNPWYF